MSDGITDMYRDERRARYLNDFYEHLLIVIPFARKMEPDAADKMKHLEVLADRCDNVPSGLWTNQTNITDGLKEWVERLISGDQYTWGRLLEMFKHDASYTHSCFDRFREISPFKGKIVTFVSYRYRDDVSAEHLKLVMSKMLQERGMAMKDDVYLLAVPALTDADIVWLGNRAYGNKIKSPYVADRK